jgi:hypothetical protein
MLLVRQACWVCEVLSGGDVGGAGVVGEQLCNREFMTALYTRRGHVIPEASILGMLVNDQPWQRPYRAISVASTGVYRCAPEHALSIRLSDHDGWDDPARPTGQASQLFVEATKSCATQNYGAAQPAGALAAS